LLAARAPGDLARDDATAADRALAMLDRARSSLPDAAGPYHPQTVAHRALHLMGALAPALLAAHVAALADLDALTFVAPRPRATSAPRPRPAG